MDKAKPTLTQRVDKHDRQIGGILKLLRMGAKQIDDLARAQRKTDAAINRLEQAQRKTDATLERFIRSLGGGNGHAKGRRIQ